MIEFYDMCFVFTNSACEDDLSSDDHGNIKTKKKKKKSNKKMITLEEIRKTLRDICVARPPRAPKDSSSFNEHKPKRSSSIAHIMPFSTPIPTDVAAITTTGDSSNLDALEKGKREKSPEASCKKAQRRLKALLNSDDNISSIDRCEFRNIMEEEFISLLVRLECLIYRYQAHGFIFYKVKL